MSEECEWKCGVKDPDNMAVQVQYRGVDKTLEQSPEMIFIFKFPSKLCNQREDGEFN